MNDMSRPQTASRLSEDIGDVLGAIRRLIAEDEALDYARSTTTARRAPAEAADSPAAPADALAERFGGAAALARRMVQDSANLRDRQATTDVPIARAGGQAVARTRPQLIADRHMPRSRAPVSDIVALRDAPTRRDAARMSFLPDLGPEKPLRLGAAERVISVIVEDEDEEQPANPALAPTPYTAFAALDTVAEVSAEPDDFAEAFDAKARMRPDLADDDATPKAAAMRLPVDLSDPSPVQADAPADPFWQAYAAQQDDDALPIDAHPVGDAVPPETADLDMADRGVATDPAGQGQDDRADHVTTDTRAEDPQTVAPVPAAMAAVAETPMSTPDPAEDAADEASVRAVIREIIQEELHGELGQRFSRNLRAVIRREVAASIDEHLERL